MGAERAVAEAVGTRDRDAQHETSGGLPRTSLTAASRILERLSGVRQTKPGVWQARCPAHEDRSPSLRITELADGRVLMHDYAGCATEDVLAAIGLTLADLFDKPIGGAIKSQPSGISPRDLIGLVDEEAFVVGLLGAYLTEHQDISAVGWERLRLAVARLGRARELVGG